MIDHADAPTVITFDDIIGRYNMVPKGYEDLKWKNADFANSNNFDFIYGESGFDHGLVSPFHVSFNHVDSKPYVMIDQHGTFDLQSVYLTAATYIDETVTVKGFRDGEVVYKQTVTVSDDAPTLFNFDFENVDKVTIVGKGGTHDDAVKGDTHQVVLDDLTLVFHDGASAPVPIHSAVAFHAGDHALMVAMAHGIIAFA